MWTPLTFPSLSQAVWIWKKSFSEHGGLALHSAHPSSEGGAKETNQTKQFVEALHSVTRLPTGVVVVRAGRTGRRTLGGEGVAGTGLTGRGAGGHVEPAGPTWKTL